MTDRFSFDSYQQWVIYTDIHNLDRCAFKEENHLDNTEMAEGKDGNEEKAPEIDPKKGEGK